MTGPVHVSIILSTYNRAALLPVALDALLAQRASVTYEVIVVDNNSSDNTAELVGRYVQAHPDRIRYVFEPQQGLSHGRNAGIRAARGAILAFTDDDVEVAPDWLERLSRAFEDYPEAAYIGGRVLPRWAAEPPAWLTDAHWSPLALQDYGDRPIHIGPSWPVCLVGANLAFRRSVFDQVGLFTPKLGRIRDGIGSTEDHDMQLRLWRAGLQGVYVPEVVMIAEVQADRMTRDYHRRWHCGHGRHGARMRLREIVPQDMAPMGRPADLVLLFGAPAFVYSELARTAWRWVRAVVRREDAFFYANRFRYVSRYLVESWRLWRGEQRAAVSRELWRFVTQYARKRARAA